MRQPPLAQGASAAACPAGVPRGGQDRAPPSAENRSRRTCNENHSRNTVAPMSRSISRVARLQVPAAVAAVAGLVLFALAGCGSGASASAGRAGVVNAVGAENEYADVMSQIGGQYVH